MELLAAEWRKDVDAGQRTVISWSLIGAHVSTVAPRTMNSGIGGIEEGNCHPRFRGKRHMPRRPRTFLKSGDNNWCRDQSSQKDLREEKNEQHSRP